MALLRGKKGREERDTEEQEAPQRWHQYKAFKNVERALENSYLIDIEAYYKIVSDLRKSRPSLEALTTKDTMIFVSNRGLADQEIRGRVSALKMNVYRVQETLKSSISLFKKTVMYEDAAWLKRRYGVTEAKTIAESACLDALTEVAELETFIGFVDILIEDIDKAAWVHQNGLNAISRETVSEKFGHR